MLSRIFITVDDYRGVMLNNCLQYSSEKKATGMAFSSASSTCLRQNARSVYYRNLRFVYTFFSLFFFLSHGSSKQPNETSRDFRIPKSNKNGPSGVCKLPHAFCLTGGGREVFPGINFHARSKSDRGIDNGLYF